MAGELYKTWRIIPGEPENCYEECTEGDCYTETVTEEVFVVDGYVCDDGQTYDNFDGYTGSGNCSLYGHYEETTYTQTTCTTNCTTVCEGGTSAERDPNLGWNASARSIDVLEGSGAVEFRIAAASVGVVCGLNEGEYAVTGYSDLHYAIYAERGQFKIVEQGTFCTAAQAFANTDVFRIERDRGTVRYYRNGTLVRTATRESVKQAFLETVLYKADDRVLEAYFAVAGQGSAALTLEPVTVYARADTRARASLYTQPIRVQGYDNGAITGSADLAFQPVTAFGGEGTYAEAIGLRLKPVQGQAHGGFVFEEVQGHADLVLQPVTGEASGFGTLGGSADLTLEPVVVVGSDYAYAHAAFDLQPITANGSGGIHLPEPVIVDLALEPVQVAAFGLTGTIGGVDASLEPVIALAAEGVYGEGAVTFEPVEALAFEDLYPDSYAILPVPMGGMEARGGPASSGLDATVPFPEVEARSGGSAFGMEVPMPEATVEAAWPYVGRGVLVLPELTADGHGLTGFTGEAALTLPALTASARGAGRAAVRTQPMTVAASGKTGAIGTLDREIPVVSVSAEGDPVPTGEATLVFEAVVVHADAVPDVMEVPMPYVRAIGEPA